MSPSLCVCGLSAVESVCCREVNAFWSLVEQLDPRPADLTCLNPFVLRIAYSHFRQDHGPLEVSTHEYVYNGVILSMIFLSNKTYNQLF